MRTGAIFARGSYRALKWMALVGVVFALGAGAAAAQQTLSGSTLEIEAPNSDEGGTTTITVTVSAEVESAATGSMTTVTVTVSAAALDASTNADELATLDATPAEETDWTFSDAELELEFVFPENTSGSSRRYTYTNNDVVLQTRNTDQDAEDEGLRLTATPSSNLAGASTDTKDIKINDAQDQMYVLKRTVPTDDPMEGDAITVTVTAMPEHEQGSAALTFTLDKPELGYQIGTITGGSSVTASGVTIGSPDGSTAATEAQNMATIPLATTVTNDVNRMDDTLTLSSYLRVGQPPDSTLPIVLKDKNALPAITAAVTDADGMAVTGSMLTEGNTYMLTLSAPVAVSEDITVALSTSGTADSTDDYSLALNSVTIADGESSSQAIRLEIDLNDDLNNESLMLSAVVSGEAANGTETVSIASLLSLTIVDATMKHIFVLDGAMDAIYGARDNAKGSDGALHPGDDFTVAKSMLFGTATGYTARVSAESSSSAASVDDSGESIVVMPDSEGTAMITLTGTAIPSASSFESGSLTPSVAEIMFEVTVAATPLERPGSPRNLEAAPGNGQVTLTWQAPNEGGAVTSYEYDLNANRDWKDAGAGTTKTVTGLENDTLYVFRVRAVNSSGAGDPTEAVSATPTSTSGVDAPVTVKSVSAATSVAESGGLEVTVTATVPAGTKGGDDKIAAIASKQVMVSFPTDDASIAPGEDADAGELTPLGATNGAYTWTNIARKEEASEATYKFRVAVGQDLDAEDEKFQVQVQIDGAAKKSKVVTIDDAQEQTYVLSLPSANKGAITEGKSAKLTLEAKPKRTIDIPVTLALEPNDPSRYALSSANGTFGRTSFETTVSAKADGDRADDTITVTAYTDRHGEFASLDITVKDANALPAVKATLVDDDGDALDPQPESVMEGETVKVMLTAVDKDGKAMDAAEKLTITLMPTGTADAQDYRLSDQSFEIAKDKESSAAVDLMITEDQDIGEETLMFDAAVAGEAKNGTEKRSVAGVLSLMIMDGTQKLVYAKTQEEVEAAIYAAKNAGAGDDMTFTEGEMLEVMGNALFSSAEGVTLSYTAESDHDHVAMVSVSGGMVMVTAGDEPGMAHITVTAHASMSSGVKILDQTDPGMASVMFPVEVGLEALSIMLTGPEDPNVAEGGMGAMVTATANRAVTEDVTVNLMRDRSMSTAGDADYTAEAITIAAGEMMGSTMVMAVEDNMAEDMEELVLYGMTEGMAGEVTGEVHLHLWDAAVPALPVIAQLLLAAFLAVGGYRRYRRR